MGQTVKFVLGNPVFKASFNKKYQLQKVKWGHLLYNINDSDFKSIFLVCLHHDDNHASHAVVTVKKNLIAMLLIHCLLQKRDLIVVVGKRLLFNMFLVVTNLFYKTK